MMAKTCVEGRSMLVVRLARAFLPACVGLMLVCPSGAQAADQERFAEPEAALKAFVEVLRLADPVRLGDLFGTENLHELVGDDPEEAKADLTRAYASARDTASLRPDGPDRMIMVIGRSAWPFPVPLVREADGWRFDTAAGVEEIANRRVGRNELAAIEVLHAYVEAQRVYASADRDGDGVLEYAQHLASTGEQRDGLYWPTAADDEPSPFGPFMAEVDDYLQGRQAGEPYRGYSFRVLTGQGPQAPGGAYSYVINGNMVAGFALFAWPAEYGDSGVMSFLVGNDGIVLETDLGPDTAEKARAITVYDPDRAWQRTTD
jgi:hypothetical protein